MDCHAFPRRRLAQGVGAWLLAAALVRPAAAHRRGDHAQDHDLAREALSRGEILPLEQVLTRIRPQLGGEVVGIHLEREDDRWLYDFRVVSPGGRLSRVHVDAGTAQLVRRDMD